MRLDRVHTLKLSMIIREENLRPDQTHAFVNVAFRDGAIQTTGTAITSVLPPDSRFFADGGHGKRSNASSPNWQCSSNNSSDSVQGEATMAELAGCRVDYLE